MTQHQQLQQQRVWEIQDQEDARFLAFIHKKLLQGPRARKVFQFKAACQFMAPEDREPAKAAFRIMNPIGRYDVVE